jgi:hypothetical protein
MANQPAPNVFTSWMITNVAFLHPLIGQEYAADFGQKHFFVDQHAKKPFKFYVLWKDWIGSYIFNTSQHINK